MEPIQTLGCGSSFLQQSSFFQIEQQNGDFSSMKQINVFKIGDMVSQLTRSEEHSGILPDYLKGPRSIRTRLDFNGLKLLRQMSSPSSQIKSK